MSNHLDYDPDYNHFNRPRHPAGIDEIQALLRQMEVRIMTAFSDAVAQLVADDTALAAEVDEMIATLAQVPAKIATAVQTALTNAGVDDEAQRAAVVAVDESVRGELAKVQAAIAPAVGADTITVPDAGSAPAAASTLGDASNDTVSADTTLEDVFSPGPDTTPGTDTVAGA